MMLESPLQSSYTIGVLQNALSLMCVLDSFEANVIFCQWNPQKIPGSLSQRGVCIEHTHMRGELRAIATALEPTQDLFLDHNSVNQE